MARRWTYPHRKPGRPPLARPRRELILRLARENPHWGYQRIAGELKSLRLAASATTVRKVLICAGVSPAPERARQSWRSFLRQQAASTLACDFFTVETLALQRIYVLFFISPATRRLEFIACTAHPDGAWVTQQARNLLMQLGEHERRFRLLIHDRDRKFSRGFDEVFRSGGIEVIRTPIQAPNANAFAERWVRTVRSDCLDRILILGRRHLERILRVYSNHYKRASPAPRAPARPAKRHQSRPRRPHFRRVWRLPARPARRTDPRVPTRSVIAFSAGRGVAPTRPHPCLRRHPIHLTHQTFNR